jgi:uncharacterized protein DUF6527
MRAEHIRMLPDSRNPAIAARALAEPGDASFVVRGVVRSLVLRCPCGCGENYIINLDKRAGPAWRAYRRKGVLSLYPSYWRDGGCGSHFIINRSEIHWCARDEEWSPEFDPPLAKKVLEAIPADSAITAREIAELLDEIPWDVHGACEKLVREGILERTGDWNDTRYGRRSG